MEPHEFLNDLQRATIAELARVLPVAHHIDLTVRVNGEDRHYEADWLKYIISDLAQRLR